MLAAYGLRSWEPGVPLGRWWSLVERLPPSARKPGEQWSTEADLLALLIDHVANLTWVTMRAAGSKAPQPKPLPRPPGRAAPAPPAPAEPPRARPGEPSGRTWADAARELAMIPGVRVNHG